MPNYVRNRLSINASVEDCEKVMNTILNEKDELDFNKIIPMPEELNIENGSYGTLGVSYIKGIMTDFEKVRFENLSPENKKEAIAIGKQYISNVEKYGFETWYEWRIANWDTKWNAMETNIYDNVIEFDTAWSAPIAIYKKLGEMFPNISFSFIYADDDVSYNVGEGNIENGEFTLNCPEGGTKEAFEIYCEVQGDCYYIWDEENNCPKYIEEEDEEEE